MYRNSKEWRESDEYKEIMEEVKRSRKEIEKKELRRICNEFFYSIRCQFIFWGIFITLFGDWRPLINLISKALF